MPNDAQPYTATAIPASTSATATRRTSGRSPACTRGAALGATRDEHTASQRPIQRLHIAGFRPRSPQIAGPANPTRPEPHRMRPGRVGCPLSHFGSVSCWCTLRSRGDFSARGRLASHFARPQRRFHREGLREVDSLAKTLIAGGKRRCEALGPVGPHSPRFAFAPHPCSSAYHMGRTERDTFADCAPVGLRSLS
jgi:hypothetical protein